MSRCQLSRPNQRGKLPRRQRVKTMLAVVLFCGVCQGVLGSSGSAPQNTVVSMVTYLGDGSAGGINTGLGTAVDSNGNVYVVGSGPFNFGLSPLGNASNEGYILKLSSNNLHPNGIFRMGKNIVAIRIRETSDGIRIMVQSDLGVAVLDANFNRQYVVANNCGVGDCIADLGRDGTVAVLKRASHKIEVYTNGQLTASADIGNQHHMDIAVDPVHHLVFHGFYLQSRPHNVPVQIPCLIARDYSLANQVWMHYCVGGEQVYQSQNMADSRVNHLYFSDVDNKLYMAGYTDGGNSIFRYNPTDITQNSYSLDGLTVMADGVKPHYDAYTDTNNFHGAHSISFIAKYNPQDGNLEKGQFIVTRLSSGVGNSVSTVAVSGGAGGLVAAAQSAVASLEHRDTQTVNGQDTADYGGTDAALLVVSPDFERRLVWTQFQKTTGHSNGVAIAANSHNGQTRVAFLASSKDSELVQINQLVGTGHANTTATDQYSLVVLDV